MAFMSWEPASKVTYKEGGPFSEVQIRYDKDDASIMVRLHLHWEKYKWIALQES
jgi:hypothetical protein